MAKYIIELPEDRFEALQNLLDASTVVFSVGLHTDADKSLALQECISDLRKIISTAEPMTIKEYRETKTLDKILSDMQNNIGYLTSQKEQLIQKQKQLETEINTTLTLLDYIKEIRSENN